METTPEQEFKTIKSVSAGSISESIIGVATIVLAIIGLGGAYPAILVSIATITIGASFVFAGSAVSSRFSNLARMESEGVGSSGVPALGIGISSEFLGGSQGLHWAFWGYLGLSQWF